MRQAEIVYESKVRLCLTKLDMEILFACAYQHYDAECKAYGQPGGPLWGAHNAGGERVFTRREVDTMRKILECSALVYDSNQQKAAAAGRLRQALRAVFFAVGGHPVQPKPIKLK